MTWQKIACEQREALVDKFGRSYNGFSDESGIRVIAGRSDLGGEFGEPSVFSEWGYVATGQPVLRDYRWPESDRPCEHYEWVEDDSAGVA